MRYTEHRLETEDEITRLLIAYGSSIDSGRLDDMARLFENGVWYLNDDLPFRGFEELSHVLRENVLLDDGVPRTRHVISNIRIDLDDDASSARAQSYVKGAATAGSGTL